MFERLKIGTKILLVTGGIVVAVILATFIVSDITARQAFQKEAYNKLTAVREMKAQQIEDYFPLPRMLVCRVSEVSVVSSN